MAVTIPASDPSLDALLRRFRDDVRAELRRADTADRAESSTVRQTVR